MTTLSLDQIVNDNSNKGGLKVENHEDKVQVVTAFRDNNLYDLAISNKLLNGSLWYKFINHKSVINNVNPIQSNILNLILRAKVNDVFGYIEMENEDIITVENLKDIFKDIVSFGQGVVLLETRFDIIDKVQKYELTFIKEDYNFTPSRFGVEEEFVFNTKYKIGEDNYILQRRFVGNIEYKTLWLDDKLVPLELLDETLEYITDYKMKMFKHIDYEFNATNVIGTLNEIDANKTQISYINAIGMPFVIDPVLLRMEPGETNIDKSHLTDVRARKYEGTVKPSTLSGEDGTEQVLEPTFVAPDLQIKTYQDSIDNLIKDLSIYFGVTLIDLGYVSLNTNIALETVNAMNKLSENSKQSDRKLLIDIISLFATGLNEEDLTIEFNDPNDTVSPELLAHYRWMYESKLISSHDMQQISMPNKTDWQETDTQIITDIANGINK